MHGMWMVFTSGGRAARGLRPSYSDQVKKRAVCSYMCNISNRVLSQAMRCHHEGDIGYDIHAGVLLNPTELQLLVRLTSSASASCFITQESTQKGVCWGFDEGRKIHPVCRQGASCCSCMEHMLLLVCMACMGTLYYMMRLPTCCAMELMLFVFRGHGAQG